MMRLSASHCIFFTSRISKHRHADHVPTVRIAPSSPVNAFVSVLRELDNEAKKEAKDSEAIQSTEESSGAAVEVNVDFARDAVDRSRARQLARYEHCLAVNACLHQLRISTESYLQYRLLPLSVSLAPTGDYPSR